MRERAKLFGGKLRCGVTRFRHGSGAEHSCANAYVTADGQAVVLAENSREIGGEDRKRVMSAEAGDFDSGG